VPRLYRPDRYDEYEGAFSQEFDGVDHGDDARVPVGAIDDSELNDGDVGQGDGFSFLITTGPKRSRTHGTVTGRRGTP
jgi:hypothetical protein